MTDYAHGPYQYRATEDGNADPTQGRDSNDSRASGTTKDQIGRDRPTSTDTGQGVNPNDDAEIVTDGGLDVTATDLTLFQQEILYHLADDGADYGLDIKRALQDRYGHEINHGRLYPNLDDLVEMGLIGKSELDKRTNEYALTDEGKWLLQADATRRAQAVSSFDAPVAPRRTSVGGDD